LKGFKKSIMLLSLVALLVFGTGFAMASNGSAYGGNMDDSVSGSSNSAPAQMPSGQQQHDDNGSYGRYSYGQTANNGYGTANMGQGDVSDLRFGGWKEWASAYRSMPDYPYVFNFSSVYELADNNTISNDQKWFNGAWDSSKYGASKRIAGQRVLTILNEMGMLKSMVNASGVSAGDRTSMVDAIDNSMQRLEDADREIQAASDMKSLGEAVARAEPYMASARSEIKANSGLLTCKGMDAEIDQAVNASDMAEARIQSMNISSEEKAWYEGKLAEYDEHVYNASQYLDEARGSFQKYSDTRNNAYFAEGLKQIELAQGERDMAFAALNVIFKRSIKN
jgi:hypothetical protein